MDLAKAIGFSLRSNYAAAGIDMQAAFVSELIAATRLSAVFTEFQMFFEPALPVHHVHQGVIPLRSQFQIMSRNRS